MSRANRLTKRLNQICCLHRTTTLFANHHEANFCSSKLDVRGKEKETCQFMAGLCWSTCYSKVAKLTPTKLACTLLPLWPMQRGKGRKTLYGSSYKQPPSISILKRMAGVLCLFFAAEDGSPEIVRLCLQIDKSPCGLLDIDGTTPPT